MVDARAAMGIIAGMEIKVDDGAIRQAVSEAIVRAIDDTKRETLITDAIRKLMDTPRTDGGMYGRPELAPIQRMFQDEVERFAREEIRKKLENDGAFKERLYKVMSDALDKAFSDSNPELLNNITKLFTESLRPKERY